MSPGPGTSRMATLRRPNAGWSSQFATRSFIVPSMFRRCAKSTARSSGGPTIRGPKAEITSELPAAKNDLVVPQLPRPSKVRGPARASGIPANLLVDNSVWMGRRVRNRPTQRSDPEPPVSTPVGELRQQREDSGGGASAFANLHRDTKDRRAGLRQFIRVSYILEPGLTGSQP
jgi:hypothetical protein